MNTLPKDKKIEKYLDELSSEYKELLYKALIEQSESLDELSVSELLRLDEKIKRPLLVSNPRIYRRRKRFLKVGILYIYVGIFMYLMMKYYIALRYHDYNDMLTVMPLIFSLAGLTAIVFSFVSPSHKRLSKSNDLYKNGNDEQLLLEYEVISKWRELEGKVTDLRSDSPIKGPVFSIDFLSSREFITKEEGNALREFLKYRNNIVHDTNVEYSPQQLKDMLDKVNPIISKIDKLL